MVPTYLTLPYKPERNCPSQNHLLQSIVQLLETWTPVYIKHTCEYCWLLFWVGQLGKEFKCYSTNMNYKNHPSKYCGINDRLWTLISLGELLIEPKFKCQQIWDPNMPMCTCTLKYTIISNGHDWRGLWQ